MRLIFLFLLFSFGWLNAFEVDVKAFVDHSQIFIGDRFNYTVEIDAPKEALVELPQFVGNMGSFEVLDWKVSEKKSAKKENSKTIWQATLNTFVSGDFALVPQEVHLISNGDTIKTITDPVPIRVSPRTTEEDLDILEEEPPEAAKGTPWYVFVGIAFTILLLAFLIYFAFKNWKRTEIVKILPPYEEAKLALSLLQAKNLAEANQAEYFLELGVILRRYAERRFEIDCLDATVSELKQRMSHTKNLEEAFKMGLVSFAEETEPVKFAKMTLPKERVAHWENFAEEFFERTRETPEQAEQTPETRTRKA